MLLGALMVVAPGAGAELPDGTVVLDGQGNVPICHATNSETNPYILNSPSYSAAGITGVNHEGHAGPVFEPGMKKDGITWGDIIPPISLDGVTLRFDGMNWTDEARELYEVCIGEPAPVGATLVVEKDVPGETVDPTKFSFKVGVAAAQEIADGGSFETTVAAGSVDITETENAAYTLTDVSCTRDNSNGGVLIDDQPVADTLVGGKATITAAAGDIITCVFTNTPKTYGLTVVKKNDATADGTFNTSETVNTAGLPVKFEVALTNTGNQPLTIATLTDTWSGLATPVDVLAAADLSCTRAAAPTTLATALPAGSTTTCTFSLPAYSPAAGTSRVNEVTATAGNNTFGKAQSTVVTNRTVIIPDPPDPIPDPPELASLRIVKAVDAVEAGVVPTEWTVDFDVAGDDLDETATLDQDDSSDRFGDLDAGSFTITETTPTGDTSSLTDVECVEAGGGDVDVTEALSDKSATVVLEEGDVVTCTFTNTYPEVLSEGETPTETVTETPTVKPTPAATPDVEVKGVQTVRALPRTGDESRGLAGMGALMLAVGAAMVLGSRRQFARR